MSPERAVAPQFACKAFGVRVAGQGFGKCECDSGKKVGCLPVGGIKKHTPGLGASQPIPFRASIA